jgi:EmrB/QacA subfamily drug resistance transporter
VSEHVRATLSDRTEHATLDLPTREKVIVMVAVLIGLFLGALDQTIVGVALPRIVSDLRGSDLYTWVVTAYLLTSTITVPIYGKLGDVFGRQRMLIVGIVIFLTGSALSGLSQSMGELIVFRALQGCGAGALFPIALAVIGDLFTPRERGRYQGLFGAVFGLSFIVGPFLGGVITDDISWHWIFYVNLPVGIVALYAISTRLPNLKTTAARLRDLDFSGIAIFTVGVVPLLIGLTFKGLTDASGNLYGWTAWQVGGLILVGLAIMAAFIVNEAHVRQPIIPLDLFSTRTLAATNVAVFMVASCMFAAVIFIPLYYQVVKGVSATASGYSMWPLLLGLIATSVGAGFYLTRTGRYKALLLIGLGVLIVGSFLMTHLSPSTATPTLWLWLALTGLGIGPSMSVFTVVIQNAAPRERLGTATSTLTFLRQVGGMVGLAIAGTVFSQGLSTQMPKQLSAAHLPSQTDRPFLGERHLLREQHLVGGQPGPDHPARGAGGGARRGASLPPPDRRRPPQRDVPGARRRLLGGARRSGARLPRHPGDARAPAAGQRAASTGREARDGRGVAGDGRGGVTRPASGRSAWEPEQHNSLLQALGDDRPSLYAFTRILLWGRLPG